MTTTPITPDTSVFIPVHNDTDMLDFILGDLSAADYARATNERGEEQSLQDICHTAEMFLIDGAFFLDEDAASAYVDENDIRHRISVRRTTPREIHRLIEARAAQEAQHR